MTEPPSETVTFLFSDVEQSTQLLERHGSDLGVALARHHALFEQLVARHGGVIFETVGDAVYAAFPTAGAGVAAAIEAHHTLAGEDWGSIGRLAVRIALHTGSVERRGDHYFGPALFRVARLQALGHGEQTLLSAVTARLAADGLPEGASLRDLGLHRLKDLREPERVFQLLHPTLRTDFPALRSVDVRANNLPTQTTRLVGRDTERGVISDFLGSASVRLVTLTGPGGIGKTRLALHAAADQTERFRDGVYFVDLSLARDAQAVLEAVVQATHTTVAADDDLRSALASQLGTRAVLLLLDNFEQAMVAVDEVVRLLELCPELRVLVTSREGLRVRGEQLMPIAPLSLPEDGHSAATAHEVAQYEAVQLFIERAQEARPDFQLTDDNAAAVIDICARLDGLPLALELAAARLNLFAPSDLRDRLKGRLELLRGGARDLPTRQRTLRSTIEWSYELLDDDERGIFQVLSLFPSARVDALEEVSAKVEPLATVDVLDRLASLVDKNLVRSVDDGEERRLSMLHTIREFAAERLEEEQDLDGAARRAHAAYFAEYARASRHELQSARRGAVVEGLASELGNLQSAWKYYAEVGDLAQLNNLVDPLWSLHDARGWYHGAAALANDLLAVLSTSAPAPDRAEDEITLRLSLARALLALRGYTEEVEGIYRDALALTEAIGSVPKRLPVLRSLASFYLYRAEIDKTAAIGREMLELAAQEADTSLQVEGHVILGPALAFMRDFRGGLDHLDRAIELFDPAQHGQARLRLGPSPGVAARAVSGLLYWLFGYPDTAMRRAASALDLAAQLRHPYSSAYATFHVAYLDLWNGRLEACDRHAAEVLNIAGEHDYQIWKAIGLVLRGVTTAGLGRADSGLALTKEGIAMYENLQTPPVFWPQVLSLKAQACALAGFTADALAALDEAAGLAREGNWDSAGLKVQRADVLLSQGDTFSAESLLRRAIEEAEQSGSRMLQLRAATRLARLVGPASRHEANARLREVTATFTEGDDDPHVQEARAILDEAGTRGV